MKLTRLSAAMSFCGKISSEIKDKIFGGKSEYSQFTASGVVGWYRYTDGQIYEIIIRPARYGEYLVDFANAKGLPKGMNKQQIAKYLGEELNTDTPESISETSTSPIK